MAAAQADVRGGLDAGGESTSGAPAPARRAWRWLAAAIVAGTLAIVWLAGLRQGVLFLIGVGYGAALTAVAFGFTTGWRVWIRERDPTGLLAQFLLLALAMVISLPLLAAFPQDLTPAAGPLSVSLVIGAFVFGAAMQVADGCGSGTLYKAGLGNPINLVALPGFIAGSFLGSLHLDAWLRLGSLGPVTLQTHLGTGGALAAQLLVLAVLAAAAWRFRRRLNTRWRGSAVFIAAIALALLAVANLVIAGQPWGIVYGLGLWGAKVAMAFGWDPAGTAYWGSAAQMQQLAAPVLDDVTSVTNIGLLIGALAVALRRGTALPAAAPTPTQWIAGIVAGLVLGYTARLAFGCNVGAYFSGITTGSLHGWVWFAAAFAGSIVGVRLRARLGFSG
ncbi:MAG TPA: YeeE/YedE thiosulfate transporter family protein [Burkholderiaceae bacterium]|nr:YeeE/YedE thiosulfate transporter family protein [Burkholderiaceae bacterium]